MAKFDSPMDKGSKVGQIETSMCEANVDKQNGPGVHSYSGTFNTGGKGGSNKIVGPGVEGQYPIKSPKETKL